MQAVNAGTARTNETILRTFPGQVIRITVTTTPELSTNAQVIRITAMTTPVQSSHCVMGG